MSLEITTNVVSDGAVRNKGCLLSLNKAASTVTANLWTDCCSAQSATADPSSEASKTLPRRQVEICSSLELFHHKVATFSAHTALCDTTQGKWRDLLGVPGRSDYFLFTKKLR